MSAATRTHLAMGGFGLGLGFVVSSSGLADWGEVHRMFTLGIPAGGGLEDLRLVFAFATAVAVALAGFQVFARRDEIPVKRIRTGTVPGALLFGAGWAIAGACPAAALVQLGEGKLEAFATVGGMLAGCWLHDRLRRRFGWARHSCID